MVDIGVLERCFSLEMLGNKPLFLLLVRPLETGTKLQSFFVSCLAGPRLTLGHWHEDRLTHC